MSRANAVSESHKREILTDSEATKGRPSTKTDRVGEVEMNLYPLGISPTCADQADPVRVERIRARVMSGAYNSFELLDLLARRLLNSGDL